MSYFSNKVVWITGASSGIGEALALQLATEKAKLILSARRTDELERVKKQCNLPETDILLLPFDLNNTAQAAEYAQQIVEKFHRIDFLVNNGGISQRSLTKDTPLDIDRKIMEVNFFSAVALTKAVLPVMLQQKSGHIITISSISGKFGFHLRSAYSASKHALHGFFESLRLETEKQGIAVTLVCPGKIKTHISINAVKGDGKSHGKMDESTEQGMSAEECANQILTAVKNKKEEILIGGKETMAVTIKRLFPSLFRSIIRKQPVE